jgi:hypothetical protein
MAPTTSGQDVVRITLTTAEARALAASCIFAAKRLANSEGTDACTLGKFGLDLAGLARASAAPLGELQAVQ